MSKVDPSYMCEKGCSPVAKQKGKDANSAAITKWNKCPLSLMMEGQMF